MEEHRGDAVLRSQESTDYVFCTDISMSHFLCQTNRFPQRFACFGANPLNWYITSHPFADDGGSLLFQFRTIQFLAGDAHHRGRSDRQQQRIHRFGR